MDELLTVAEVANRLKVDTSTVRRMSDRGDIPVALRIGDRRRYRWDDVEGALAVAQEVPVRAVPARPRRHRTTAASVTPKMSRREQFERLYGRS